MNELLSWGAPLTIALACIGFAFAVLQYGESSVDEFWIARGFFLIAAIVGLGRISLWGLTTSRSTTTRLLVGLVAWGLIVPFAIEAVRYVNRRHTRWAQQQISANASVPTSAVAKETALEQEPRLEPNFVCAGAGLADAYLDLGMFSEDNILLQGEKMVVALAGISNEFSATRKVGVARYVSAEIEYQADDGEARIVKRGSWVSQSGYKVDFNVNDRRDLIIAVMPLFGEYPRIFFLSRELLKLGENISNRALALTKNSYRVKVRLIRESEGVIYKEFVFSLEITREPTLKVELHQIKGDESS